jgi:hypothetical protein
MTTNKPDIDTIKKRRDWRQGLDLSQFELRLDDEHLAKHYAEDVTALIDEVERLRADIRVPRSTLRSWQNLLDPIEDWNTNIVGLDIEHLLEGMKVRSENA